MSRSAIFLLILLSSVSMAGTALPQPTSDPAPLDFDTFQLLKADGAAVAPVTVDQAADALKDYDVVVIGELHDHIANHLAELALLRAIHARAPRIALSMEMFERDQQPTVDDYLAGKIGESTLTGALSWRNYDEAYRPLVEFAKDRRLAVIAANAPGKIVRCVGREGISYLSKLQKEKRDQVAAEIHSGEGAYKQKFMGFLNSNAAHGGSKDAQDLADKSFAAQVTRDDTMAESIAKFLAGNPEYKVLHITGTFHAEERLGTIERLSLRAPDLQIALVLPLPAESGATLAASDLKGADYGIRIRKAPEPYATDKEKKDAEARETARFREAAKSSCAG